MIKPGIKQIPKRLTGNEVIDRAIDPIRKVVNDLVVAYSQRMNIDTATGWISYSMMDNRAHEHRSALRFFGYHAELADDGTLTLPEVVSTGIGFVCAGTATFERAQFYLASDGTVTLVSASANVVANATTDGNLCVGTAVQSPLIIQNRLGGPRRINVLFWGDK